MFSVCFFLCNWVAGFKRIDFKRYVDVNMMGVIRCRPFLMLYVYCV